jgi:hypothetical protein
MRVLDARQDLGPRLGQLRRADLVRLIEMIEGVEAGDDLIVERARGAALVPGRDILGAAARGSGR